MLSSALPPTLLSNFRLARILGLREALRCRSAKQGRGFEVQVGQTR